VIHQRRNAGAARRVLPCTKRYLAMCHRRTARTAQMAQRPDDRADAKLSGILLEARAAARWWSGSASTWPSAPEVPEGRGRLRLSAVRDPRQSGMPFRARIRLPASFATELERWRTTGLEPLIRRWNGGRASDWERSLRVGEPGETPSLEGTFAGLTSDGALQLKLADGTTRSDARRRSTPWGNRWERRDADRDRQRQHQRESSRWSMTRGRYSNAGRIATDAKRTADEYAVWLDQLLRMEGYARTDVTDVIIATVVPRALHNLQVLSQKYFGTDALIAGRPPVEWIKHRKISMPAITKR
jgi:hypothetical protein